MSVEAPTAWQPIGEHHFRLEPPDLFLVRPQGPLSGPEMTQLFDEIERFAAGKPYVFWLSNSAGLTVVAPEARKVAATRLKRLDPVFAASFGASFHVRVASKLVVEAVRALFPSMGVPELEFFETEADARAWIRKRKSELGAGARRDKGQPSGGRGLSNRE